MKIVVYSSLKPNIKADKYFCLSVDMEKIYETDYTQGGVDWVCDENDKNALFFLFKIFTTHPSAKKGIHIKNLSVKVLNNLPYCYNFLDNETT